MEGWGMSCEKRQMIVYFDVGGVIFRVLRETIQNYPSSLLAKLVDEFPNLGHEDKPVYIDRNPKAFEWIREIYRNGDFESCIPDLSRAALVRELNFYQLPDVAKLGISSCRAASIEIKEASHWCGRILAEELTKRDLWKSLPLYVWFYKEANGAFDALSEEKVFIKPDYRSFASLGVTKEQSILNDTVSTLSLSNSPFWIHLRSKCDNYHFLLRNPANPSVSHMLRHAALEYGLRLKCPWGLSSSKGILSVEFEDSEDSTTS